jgi:hypothetical protein
MQVNMLITNLSWNSILKLYHRSAVGYFRPLATCERAKRVSLQRAYYWFEQSTSLVLCRSFSGGWSRRGWRVCGPIKSLSRRIPMSDGSNWLLIAAEKNDVTSVLVISGMRWMDASQNSTKSICFQKTRNLGKDKQGRCCRGNRMLEI